MYKIIIQKAVKNPLYEEELQDMKKRAAYQTLNIEPQQFFYQDCLTTDLEENEWKAVKKAIIDCK